MFIECTSILDIYKAVASLKIRIAKMIFFVLFLTILNVVIMPFFSLEILQRNAFAAPTTAVPTPKALPTEGDGSFLIRQLEESAKQGDARAQLMLGGMYEKAKSISRHYDKAIYYYGLSANQGNADAQARLGILYYEGKGVAQNYEKARHYFELSAKQGHADAQVRLGFMYYYSEGIPQNHARARYYFELSAQRGNSRAQYNLGFMYYYGEGVLEDAGKALYYYRLAAKQGNARAQCNLGIMYYTGKGVSEDYAQAYGHILVAEALEPNNDSFQNLKRTFFAKLTPRQNADAHAIATKLWNEIRIPRKD